MIITIKKRERLPGCVFFDVIMASSLPKLSCRSRNNLSSFMSFVLLDVALVSITSSTLFITSGFLQNEA